MTRLIIERRVVTSDRGMSRLLLPGTTRKAPAYGTTIDTELRTKRPFLFEGAFW